MTNGGGRMGILDSGRYRANNGEEFFGGTITSSMSSGGQHQRLSRQGKFVGREVRTSYQLATGFERISLGSGSEVHHNFKGLNPLLSTIGSGGTDGEGNKRAMQHMNKQDSAHSIQSGLSKNDGGPIDPEKILKNNEQRTFIMVKNIPCRYTNIEIKQDFD